MRWLVYTILYISWDSSGKEQWVFRKVSMSSVSWELLVEVPRNWCNQTQSRKRVRPWYCISGYRGHPRIVQKEEHFMVEALVCFYHIHVHSLMQYEHHREKPVLEIPRVKLSFHLKFSSVRCKPRRDMSKAEKKKTPLFFWRNQLYFPPWHRKWHLLSIILQAEGRQIWPIDFATGRPPVWSLGCGSTITYFRITECGG